MSEPQPAPRVSVVVLSYNTRDLLLSCLRAMGAHHTRPDIEIIVVDNASTDGSAQAVREQFPAVELVASDRNLLFAGGMNLGARRARGAYVLFLNADTEVSPEQLEALTIYLQQHPEVGAVGPRQVGRDGKLDRPHRLRELSPLGMLVRLNRADALFRRALGRPVGGAVAWLPGACLMVRGGLARELGFFDEGFPFYLEDVDFCRRIWERGYQVHLADQVIILHDGGASAGQLQSHQQTRWMQQGFVRYVRKHFSSACASFLIGARLARYLLASIASGLLTLATLGLARRLRASTGRALMTVPALWEHGFGRARPPR
jgi:GT2 family glycosyltransferase